MTTDIILPTHQSLEHPSTSLPPLWSVDLAIDLWIEEKGNHTGSQRTKASYRETLKDFRAALQFRGLDLDSVQAQEDKRLMQVTRDEIKQIAQVFAGFSKKGKQVKPATINHRLAVLSSFYAFCIKQEWLDYNPVDHLGRSKVESYTDVKSLPFDEIAAMFDRFDLSNPEDVRDCALLAIALQTGHRVTALANLCLKHVTVGKNKIATLFFERCKGNKQATVELDEQASKALLRWLHKQYGQQWAKLPGDTPLWVSLARGGYNRNTKQYEPCYGKALSIQAIGQICKKWTGTAHVHRLRNTFVMGMLESGAKLQDIQSKLLHSSMATTSGYVDKLQSAKNAHASDLSKLFGIK